MKRRRRIVEDESRPLTDAELDMLRRHINSPLLNRALKTIEELKSELAARERQLVESRAGSSRS